MLLMVSKVVYTVCFVLHFGSTGFSLWCIICTGSRKKPAADGRRVIFKDEKGQIHVVGLL